MPNIHASAFGPETRLKLDVFRNYTREWLPVFLAQSHAMALNVVDLFAGPGTDAAGNPGSPLILADAVEEFLQTVLLGAAHQVRLILNEAKPRKFRRLRGAFDHRPTPGYAVTLWQDGFAEAFERLRPVVSDPSSANLVILDQYGFRHVNADVLRFLANCRRTDILFFVSSSHLRRFVGTPEVQGHFALSPGEVSKVSAEHFHRFLCERVFRPVLPVGLDYYLAPFSIRKGANVYGLVFGSGNLLGVEKFLRVAWGLAPDTGEANYNIDDDLTWGGQLPLFAEKPRKLDRLENDLTAALRRGMTNQDVYRFVLTHGCLPKHGAETLRRLEAAGRLSVTCAAVETRRRRGDYYLTHKAYESGSPSVCFGLKGP